MALLRDIIARFNVSVDSKDLQKLDGDLNKVRENLKSVGTQAAVAFGAMSYGAFELVSLASHATENLNVLSQSFGANKDEILNWSTAMGKALGRSKYELQEYAGRFGSFLQPAFEGTDKDIAGMSEQLTQLALDLASFYDVSEQEAMMRLSSGLRGETEAVRMWGIDLSDEGLTQFNTEQSGGKDTRHSRNLSMQEKNALRFAKILKDTEAKQGDLVRTQDELAGTVRRLKSQMNELAVDMGMKLLPVVKDGFQWAEHNLMPLFSDLALETNAVQHGFELAGGAALVLALSFLSAHKTSTLMGLTMTGLMLVFDDLRGASEGAKTALDVLAGKEEGEKSTWASVVDFATNNTAAGADIGSSFLSDLLGLGLTSGEFGGEKFTGFGQTREAYARAQAVREQGDLVDSSQGEAFIAQRRAALEARDPLAFAAAYKNNRRIRPDDANAAYMDGTRRLYERGDRSNTSQDIANGVALPGTENTPTGSWQNAGRTSLDGFANQINVTVHARTGADEHEIAKTVGAVVDTKLRQAAASVGDEKSGGK